MGCPSQRAPLGSNGIQVQVRLEGRRREVGVRVVVVVVGGGEGRGGGWTRGKFRSRDRVCRRSEGVVAGYVQVSYLFSDDDSS